MTTPRYQLGDLVSATMARPPWTGKPVTLVVDGLRRTTDYEEQWPNDPDGPSVLAATPGEWEYRLIARGHDRHGNETVNDWGWLAESKVEPAETVTA